MNWRSGNLAAKTAGTMVVLCVVVGVIVVGLGQSWQRRGTLARLRKLGADCAQLSSSSVREDVLLRDGYVARFPPAVTDRDIEQAAADLRALHRLSLDLGDADVGDAALQSLQGALNIHILNVAGTSVSDAGLASVASMKNLVSLSLTGCRVSDAGLAELAALTKLRYLYVSRTKITDAGLRAVERLPDLREIVVGYGDITPAGAELLQARMPSVTVTRVGPPYGDPLEGRRVTAASGAALPADGGPCVEICRQYFAALHRRDAFTLKQLWSRTVSVSFRTIRDDVLEIRPTAVTRFAGFQNDMHSTVSVWGPTPSGDVVQYDVQFVKEADDWRIVHLHLVLN